MAQGRALKEQKYDRQLRLWGDHGQEALESAHVCLVNASATGTEILKNLVLPGIGSFTIVDGNQVSGDDVGNNFFLQRSSIGKNRAQNVMELLQELNQDVSGHFVEESPETLLDNNPSFFCRFSVVVATQLPESTLMRLAEVLWDSNIPFLVCRTYGLVGYLRIVVKEHTVIESHPDNALEDLRLDQPFPELNEHLQTFSLDGMERKNNGQMPKNYKEKEAFRAIIRQGILKNENGVPEDEENFEEAIKNVNTALADTKIPSNIDEIFNDDHCANLSQQSPSFWILAHALKEFVSKEGRGTLPVRGTIPDMIADSDKFIKLQSVYRERAKKDAGSIEKYAAQLLLSLGKPPECISQKDIRLFCRNAAFLRVVRCRSLSEEYCLDTMKKDDIVCGALEKRGELRSGRSDALLIQRLTSCLEPMTRHLSKTVRSSTAGLRSTTPLSKIAQSSKAGGNINQKTNLQEKNPQKQHYASWMDNPDSEIVLYLMLRAVDRFQKLHGRYPGVYNYQVEDDIGKLKTCLIGFLQEYGLTVMVKDDYIHEFCRYGAAEPHTIASFLGGAAAQEVIKIITGQFVIFNNTFVYNGMSQTSATFQL